MLRCRADFVFSPQRTHCCRLALAESTVFHTYTTSKPVNVYTDHSDKWFQGQIDVGTQW